MIALTNPTGRSTEARMLQMGKLTLWFSYSTCIAFRYNDFKYRLPQWMFQRTTRKHMRELGVGSFDYAEPADFNQKLDTALSLHVSDINHDE